MAKQPTLASYLRGARTKRGLSVIDTAERAGVSAASIYLWETGKARPRDTNLVSLCKVLKLPIRTARDLADR